MNTPVIATLKWMNPSHYKMWNVHSRHPVCNSIIALFVWMGDPTPSTQSKYYSFNSCIALLQEEETEIHENDNVNVFLYIYLHIAREVSEDLLRNLKLTCQHAVLFLFYMCSCVTCLSMMVFSEGVCVRMLKWRCCPQEWNGSREDFTWWTSESIKGNAMLLILFFFCQ